MTKNYSMKNLQKASFQQKDLAYASFAHSDLRGAKFTGSDLTGADFTNARTGITPRNVVFIFILAFVISLLSGYIAMLATNTIRQMLKSPDQNIRIAAISTIVIVVLFIAFSIWKGVGNAIRQLVLPVAILAIIIGVVAVISGLGTGMGVLYLVVALLLVVVMFIIGTLARAAAGSLSNILFFIVALSGGLFSKSIGGGIGTAIMAVSCAVISKRALAGKPGFDSLRKISHRLTSRFGTSFRDSKLQDADFTRARIHNSDFTNVDLSNIKWNTSKRVNCIIHPTNGHKREDRDQQQ